MMRFGKEKVLEGERGALTGPRVLGAERRRGRGGGRRGSLTTDGTQTICTGSPCPTGRRSVKALEGTGRNRKRWKEQPSFLSYFVNPCSQVQSSPWFKKNRSGSSQLLSLPWVYAWVSLSCLLGERVVQGVTGGEISLIREHC